MKLFGITKKLMSKKKNRQNVSSLEVVESVSTVNNQYQQKSETLYNFTTNENI